MRNLNTTTSSKLNLDTRRVTERASPTPVMRQTGHKPGHAERRRKIMTATKTYDNPVEELAALLAFLNTKTAAEKREILKVTEGAKVAVKYYTNDSR